MGARRKRCDCGPGWDGAARSGPAANGGAPILFGAQSWGLCAPGCAPGRTSTSDTWRRSVALSGMVSLDRTGDWLGTARAFLCENMGIQCNIFELGAHCEIRDARCERKAGAEAPLAAFPLRPCSGRLAPALQHRGERAIAHHAYGIEVALGRARCYCLVNPSSCAACRLQAERFYVHQKLIWYSWFAQKASASVDR